MQEEEKLRLLGNRLLVKLDSPAVSRTLESDSGDEVVLHYPTGAHGSHDEINVWGKVLQVGPGRWTKKGKRVPIEVEAGDRVMVVWYLAEVESNKGHRARLGNNTIIISPEDIICVEDQ